MNDPLQPRYLTLSQAAVYLGYGEGKGENVRWLCRTGLLPHIKVGARIWVDREDIDKLMQDHRKAA